MNAMILLLPLKGNSENDPQPFFSVLDWPKTSLRPPAHCFSNPKEESLQNDIQSKVKQKPGVSESPEAEGI